MLKIYFIYKVAEKKSRIKWIKRKQMTHENTYRDDNTLFHVYPTTARMENFAGLVKRHLAGFSVLMSSCNFDVEKNSLCVYVRYEYTE
jgi:hypothetical protein